MLGYGVNYTLRAADKLCDGELYKLKLSFNVEVDVKYETMLTGTDQISLR